MENRQIIKQIRKFHTVKPDKDWVCETKQHILGEKGPGWFSLHQQAFLIGAATSIAVLVLVGVFGFQFFQHQKNGLAEYESIALSLKELKTSLNQITLNLRNIREPERVLGVKEAVNSTILQGEELLTQAKEKAEKMRMTQAPKLEVLSALTDVESALSEIKAIHQEMQKEAVEREIQELKSVILTEAQQEALKQAEEYFKAGNYAQALIKIIEVSQIR